jgi:hypothetical protein
LHLRTIKTIGVAVLGLLPCALWAADIEPPESFEVIEGDAPSAIAQARNCIPSLSESAFSRMVRDSLANKSIVTTRPADKAQPYLSVHGGKAYCIRVSERHFPILPLSAFDNTVTFPDMPRDDERRLRASLASQLAARGVATMLVVNPAGNANHVAYLFASDTPLYLYYNTVFMKKGEYAEADYPVVFKGPGTMVITGRGASQEYSKVFFLK